MLRGRYIIKKTLRSTQNLRFKSSEDHRSGKSSLDPYRITIQDPAAASNIHLNPANHHDLVEALKRSDVGSELSPPDARLLRVNVLGVPNAGKSTLINSLVGANVCAHSVKVHTTRVNARAVLTTGNTQVVFLDTPGVVKVSDAKKFKNRHW